MARFRLRLITPNNDNNFSMAMNKNAAESFLTSIITDYNSQRNEYISNKTQAQELEKLINSTANDLSTPGYSFSHSMSYTYDEKFSKHKNGQKELTFKMDDKVFINNEWVENPYARILQAGTQIELVDKYNNFVLFTIQKINFTFNNTNIVYNVTCQDSFTYQLSRQNSGYALTNDETSRDFIGALDIDKWAQRIVNDCYVTYQYVPLDTGIYQDIDGVLHTFEVPGDDVEYSIPLSLETETGASGVAKIVKPIYFKNQYPDYFQTFVFSASGSNADAALISLADQIGMQLVVIEGPSNNESDGEPIIYNRYFFFAPSQNPEVSGLTYSPLRDVQNFSLSFSGDSLTTVLNVKSTTWEDEEIGLIPNLPTIISSVVLTDEKWTNSIYYPGFFYDIVQGIKISNKQIFVHDGSDIKWEKDERNNTYYCEINKDILKEWPVYYNQIAFSWSKNEYTSFNQGNNLLTPHNTTMGVMMEEYSNQNVTLGDLFDNIASSYYSNLYSLSINAGDYWTADFNEQSWVIDDYLISIKRKDNQIVLVVMQEDATTKGSYNQVNPQDTTIWQSCEVKSDYLSGAVPQKHYYPEYTDIPQELIENFNKDSKAYLYITAGSDSSDPIINDCYIYFTRQYTQDELTFAEVAEQCPWLENKIMDFSYFVRQGIISKAEYENIMHLLLNDLRIINGQLMCYANAYLQSLHRQTQILADLQNSLDQLGAQFFADVVQPFETSGGANTNLATFDALYTAIFDRNIEGSSRIPLLGLDNLIGEYFTKYFAAEQRFFKNMYNFRKYFEAKNVFATTTNNILQETTYTVESTNPNILVGFKSAVNWKKLSSTDSNINKYSKDIEGEEKDFSYILNPLYSFDNSRYTLYKIPNPQNYKEFYVPNIISGNKTQVSNNHTYSARNIYLYTKDAFEGFFGEKLNKQTIIKIGNEEYVRLKLTHIKKLFLHNHPDDEYYIRDVYTKVPFEWVRCNQEVLNNTLNPLLWGRLDEYAEFLSQKDAEDILQKAQDWSTMWNYYKAALPVSELYVKDYNLQYSYAENGQVEEDTEATTKVPTIWNILDENNYAYKKVDDGYKKYNPITKKYEETVDTDKLYQTYYSLSYPTVEGNYSLIINQENDVSINWWNMMLWTCKFSKGVAQTGFYTKHHVFNWNAFWAWSGGGFAWPIGLIGANVVKNLKWETKDIPDYSLLEYGSTNEGKNKDLAENLGIETYTRGDSYYVNYVRTADSEETIHNLTIGLEQSSLSDSIKGSSPYHHYLNYYAHIVPTYSLDARSHNDSDDIEDNYQLDEETHQVFWINNRYARFCTVNDGVNLQDKYYLVRYKHVYNNENSDPIFYIKEDNNGNRILPERFSAVKFYPVIENQIQIDITSLFETTRITQNDITIGELAEELGLGTSDENYLFTRPFGQDTVYFCILHYEPYEKGKINNEETAYINPTTYNFNYKGIQGTTEIYHWDTDRPLQTSELVLEADENLFYIPDQDAELVPVISQSAPENILFNPETHWYAANDIDSRTYTVDQIIQENSNLNFYYVDSSSFNDAEFVRENAAISRNFTLALRHFTLDKNNVLILDDTEEHIITDNIVFENKNETEIKSLTIDGTTFNIKRSAISTNLGSLSNGALWYLYHNRIDLPGMLEKVAVIETELTGYWTSAYTASQYCQWFLPPTWTVEQDQTTNFFAKWLYGITNKNEVKLLNVLVPQIDIYNYNGETVLPDYIYHYFENTPQDQQPGTKLIENTEYLRENPAVLNAVNHILKDETESFYAMNPSSFTAQEYGKRTYYYRLGGGLERQEVAHFMNNSNHVYPQFDGLYPMQLRLFFTQYYNTPYTKYEELRDKKLVFWRKLYARYPGIFLENTYENSDARSPTQLLQMAKLAFKDYTSPEKQYNITIIHAADLMGFEGQELHLGDSILLKASDYYDAVDETYRALNQYLFISDISYSLRQDTDISLTVNTIKYQDKLLQSIVKLIR